MIKGERKMVHEEDKDTVHSVEKNYGRVQRMIPLPLACNTNAATARFENGVLYMSFPKTAGGTKLGKSIYQYTIPSLPTFLKLNSSFNIFFNK